MSPANQPVKVFYSYSHEDEDLRNQLEKQLTILKRHKVISTWHDRKIEAGSEWDSEISKHLDEADIILLLISADFLASDYAYEVEAPRAMQRHRAHLARVIPIILRPVDNWKSAPFGKLQALPRDGLPITSWNDREEAFANIARGIREIVEGEDPIDEEGSADSEVNIPPLLPYLCDRSQQEAELTEALQHHQSTKPRRPFICVIHGGEEESHLAFVDRMTYAAIPQALNLAAKQFALERHECEWPSRDVPVNRWSKILAANLGKALLRNSAAPAPEMVKYIALHERPVLLESYVLTDSFLESGTDLFDQFLKFWNAWPELPPGRTVINCVSVKHLRLDRMGFFQRRNLRRLHERLFDYINKLNFSSYEKLGGVVLPELKGIRRTDVEAWSRIKEVRQHWQIQDKDIRALYERVELISMEPLAEQLRALLIKYQHQRG